MPSPQRRLWEWHFDHPPKRVWPILADTARWNEAAGLPKHTISEKTKPDGSVEFSAAVRVGPFSLRWQEMPVNWVEGEWLEHRRIFENGPFRYLNAKIHLLPDAPESKGQGAIVRYALEAEPANLLGRAILAAGFFRSAERNFSRLASEANFYLSGKRDRPFPYAPPPLSPILEQRLRLIVRDIEESPYGHGLAAKLVDFLMTSQEADLWRIRPFTLARRWGKKPLQVTELCLQAVRQGLLEMHWDILCPRCRGAKVWAGTLDRLPEGAHCSSCNIEYDRDFARNVEASFHPAPNIRVLETGEYCLWGPMSVPHVKAQIDLQPGEIREIPGKMAAGPYRLRSLEPGPEIEIETQGQGFLSFILDSTSVIAGPATNDGTLRFENRTSRRLTAIIEDRRWIEDALTGDKLTAMQGFRDLFAEDVLRPGDEVAIGRVALMFSDLKESTALYQRIGDAPAYHLVREHFALLARVVRRHEGAIVKTIGDSVMAAFVDSAMAIEAAKEILSEIAAFNQSDSKAAPAGIEIKLGLHVGPAIIVTLNDRLDYFGSTVNLAARLQDLAEAGEIVLSADILADSGLGSENRDLKAREAHVEVKGFQAPILIYHCRP